MQVFISAQTGGLCVRVKSEDGDCDQDYLPWEEILSHLDRVRGKDFVWNEAALAAFRKASK